MFFSFSFRYRRKSLNQRNDVLIFWNVNANKRRWITIFFLDSHRSFAFRLYKHKANSWNFWNVWYKKKLMLLFRTFINFSYWCKISINAKNMINVRKFRNMFLFKRKRKMFLIWFNAKTNAKRWRSYTSTIFFIIVSISFWKFRNDVFNVTCWFFDRKKMWLLKCK